MRKTTLRRLEALEKEERSREQQKLVPLRTARALVLHIVLAYYLGGLEPDENSPGDAHARALNYPSGPVYFHELIKKDYSEIGKRYYDAYRRLFAKVGLDIDSAAPSVLCDAFVTMVNQLPEQWLNWLKSHLQEHCPTEIDAGSSIPRWLSSDNFPSNLG